MEQGEVFVVDEQEELDPNDAWLMRAAGGEEEIDANELPMGAVAAAQDDDQLSFEDSERFEEDSLCSWMSDAESLNQNWRGWSTTRNPTAQTGIGEEHTFGDGSGPLLPSSLLRFTGGITSPSQSRRHPISTSATTMNLSSPASTASICANTATYNVRSLAEMAARVAARCFSFVMLEACYHAISVEKRRINLKSGMSDCSVIFENAFAEHAAIPDKFFLSIVRWCFPESEEDVRLYSCLANGNADEFDRGEYLYQANAVHDVFQIGYHISAVVNATGASSIVTPTSSSAPPCRSKVTYNVSVRVDRCRIVSCSCSCAFKASWCQHVVAYLPVAQRLIDQLRNPNSEINAAVGAPDPTDGGHDNVAIWCLDQRTLHENIRRILINDVQYLSSNQPPAASEWLSLFRPHRAKEPEGLWNLLSIVREMFKRRDENATSLLHIITEECLACSQVLIWWYQTALSQSGQWTLCSPSTNKSSSLMSNQKTPQLNCASLCDEIVQLWRLAALNPRLSSFEREQLTSFIQIYHRNAVERIWKYICFLTNPETSVSSQAAGFIMSVVDRQGQRLSAENARFTADLFPGFLSALRACQISWNNTNIQGLLFGSNNNMSTTDFPNKLSPNIPVLRRPLRVSEDTTLLDISTSFYRTSVYTTGTNYFSLHQQASRKRRKKSRISGRRGHQFEFHDERSLIRAVRAAACAAREAALGEEVEDDSAESGQESEAGPSRNNSRTNSTTNRNESAATLSSMNYPKNDVDELFAIAHVQQSNWDIKFARCEALMSHGYAHHACVMAVELAEEMLRRPPNLLHHPVEHRYNPELSAMQRHRRTRFSQPGSILEVPVFELDEQLIEKSQLAENIYTRTLFLVQALMKEPKTHRLAFTLAISVLEIPRSPAANKFLEVKLYYLKPTVYDLVKETELVSLLRKIEIGTPELQIIRDRARRFVDNAIRLASAPQPCVLPISLGHYILDSLSFSHNICQGRRTTSGIVTKSGVQRRPCDEELAIKVALEALGMKLVVSEADYSMLCESTRLQRGDLALTVLLRYKDNIDKLALVLDKLLDPTMHRMYRDHHSNAVFFLEQDPLYKKYFNGQRPHFPFKDEFPRTDFTEASNAGLSGAETSVMIAENMYEKRANNGKNETEHLINTFMRLSHDSPDDSSSITSASRRRSSDESNDSPYDESSSSGVSRCIPRDRLHESHSASIGTSDSPSPAHRLSNIPTVDSTHEFSSAPAGHPVELNNVFYRHNRRKPIPSMSNQASEGQAHCMMELAKRPHRQLHICSFLIGLYALGLNNLLSASWQTRTYSTNVSWIHGQAIEIGCAAIKIVERVWETHLTPTEVAALADKASQSRDPCMVEAAAKLALSVLPKAYALTAAESQKALHQCKEQSSEMLEKACRAVEQAAEKDGVYPEVLFKVARHWFDLFIDSESVSSPQTSFQNAIPPQHPTGVPQLHTDVLQSQTHESVYSTTNPPALQLPVQCRPVPYPAASYHFMPPPHHHLHQAGPHCPPLYVSPVSCTQPQVGIHYSQRGPLPVGAMSIVPRQQPSTIYPPPVVGATPSRALHISHSAPNLSPMQAVQMSRRNQPLTVLQQPICLGAGMTRCQFPTVGEQCIQPIPINDALRHLPPPTSLVLCQSTSQPVTYFGQSTPQPPMNVPLPSPSASVVGDPRMAKLVHAHRVGMIAMETMGSRNLDDNRSYAKFSQNPAYAEDVRWLFTVATRLGGVFTQSFCEVAARSVASPFVLFSLAVESAKVFHWQMPSISYHSQAIIHPVRPQLTGGAPNVRTMLLQNGFAPPTADLMQHCVEMFYAASSSKLSHPRFVPSDVEEVVQLVKTAKEAFHWIPGPGKLMFEDFMRHVRKQKACKKDVAQRINACVQNTN
uniref:SWIM-type domain-containing protein n=2 Tax=Wuchereria bancrofti TaxID=6293 RepID=A0A1I8EKE8_WUCBA